MVDNVAVQVEDLLPVRSRVSWGAIFAGAMVALALYFLLTLLGSAIGLSVSGRVRAETLGVGAAVWAVLTTVVSLFVGGYVTSQCSVGENRFEAVLYGVILWGVLFSVLLWLMASGVRSGFNAMVGMAQVTQSNDSFMGWEEAARRAGVSQERIDEWRAKGVNVPDKAHQQEAEDASVRVAWWAFVGTLASMLAAVGGAYVGSGPRFRLVAVPFLRARGVANVSHTAGIGH
jgi:hypothetical protein